MSIKHERYHGVAMYTIYNSTLWLAFKLHLRIQGAYKSLFLHRKSLKFILDTRCYLQNVFYPSKRTKGWIFMQTSNRSKKWRIGLKISEVERLWYLKEANVFRYFKYFNFIYSWGKWSREAGLHGSINSKFYGKSCMIFHDKHLLFTLVFILFSV